MIIIKVQRYYYYIKYIKNTEVYEIHKNKMPCRRPKRKCNQITDKIISSSLHKGITFTSQTDRLHGCDFLGDF